MGVASVIPGEGSIAKSSGTQYYVLKQPDPSAFLLALLAVE